MLDTYSRRSERTSTQRNSPPGPGRAVEHALFELGKNYSLWRTLSIPTTVGDGVAAGGQEARLASYPQCAANTPSAATRMPCACSCRTGRIAHSPRARTAHNVRFAIALRTPPGSLQQAAPHELTSPYRRRGKREGSD